MFKGIVQRYRVQFDGVSYGLVVLVVLLGLAWFFYHTRSLPARIYILNFGVAGMVLLSTFRIYKTARGTTIDRAFFWTYLLFGLSFFPRTFLLVNSSLGKDAIAFSQTPFWLALQLSLLLFAVMLALILLAAAMLDIIDALQHDRNTDGLTKLLNRRNFEERGKHVLNSRGASHVSLIMCDLDRFKAVNDSYGHHAGDVALIKFSNIIRRCIRKTDFAYRFGGEEFVILMPETTLHEAAILAERLRTEISNTNFPEIEGLSHITCSFGVAESMSDDTLDSLVRRGDNRLYAAKNAGRNIVIVDDERQSATSLLDKDNNMVPTTA